ncbi:hypothetical protein [Flavobacterium sp.]|uniref:hypothetical protein n=1 Tax=Flavobacterium sp. TaxID=239 RepID=UPI002635B104|nr:hypothetical protein [Flavobacterium sp.]
MSKILSCIIIMLLYQFSFGQQTHTVTEGQLYCIAPGKGIVIQKGADYYHLQIEVRFEGKQQKIKSVVSPIKKEEAETLFKQENAISYDKIDGSYNFKKLQELQFTYTDDDTDKEHYEIRKLCQFNPNYFAIFSDKHQNDNVYTNIEEFLPYIFIQFDQKRILYTYDNEPLYLIPVQNKILLFGLFDAYVPELKVEKKSLTNREIYTFSNHAFYDLKEDYFKIDTLSNKKVQLKNCYNETLIRKTYDTITLGKIIIGYAGKSIDVYNLTFKKLNQHKVKAVKVNPGFLQLIEKNNLKSIDWTGQELKTKVSYMVDHIYEPTPREYFYEIALSKKNTDFRLTMRNLNDFGFEDQYTVSDSIVLQNTTGIQEIYLKNATKDTIKNGVDFGRYSAFNKKERMSKHVAFDNVIVTFLRKDGTFGMNYLHYFLKPEDKADYFIDNNAFTNYQNLQSVVYKAPFYKIKKNDLFLLFPLQKQFRYKNIGDFQGYFARFELGNGQKGWLDLKGNEYNDD